MIITIDGYSWLGKSYIGERLSHKLEIGFFSTGMLVRFVACKFVELENGISTEKAAVEKALRCVEESQFKDLTGCKFLYDDKTEQALKIVEKYSFVDRRLENILKHYVQGKSFILDGRFTFNIFPLAYRKYYFRSTVERRAELVSKIKNISFEDAVSYIHYRDSFEKEVYVPENVCVLDPFEKPTDKLIEYLLKDISEPKRIY